ncbi:probable serine/threonine-protein kinase PBL3 [Andrographis paniculata]|uniref:probable serine/threonine-protein kinase PBL3 n=1 Tax=Andrographis paniculata TaxID=175694 RepID=UPI0021E83C3F|nr:probable serine/threonine-protein kinase PBL3 [Andrographis paniculata]
MGICFGSPARSDTSSSQLGFGAKVAPGSSKHSLNSSNQLEANPTISSDAFIGSLNDLYLSSNLKSFTFNDLKNATKNFCPENLIGEGGFGYVYKGWINEATRASSKPGTGTVVAVKKLKAQSFQGHREWLTEAKYLGQLQHENLVKLIGYCLESQNRLLVYEFMPKGSLENHLFKKGVQPMAWTTRLQIATDISRGLSFLHSLNANIIFRDLKASNVLIDSKFHAKLSDFGLARNGPVGDGTHVSTRVVGTMGYAAPEYVASGHLTSKSDVYSFGVVLLELLSGRRAMGDESIGGTEGTLVDWAKQYLGESRQFSRIMDTRLRGEYAKKGAHTAAMLALKCLCNDPKNRPTMVEVLAELEQLQTLETSPRAKLEHRVKTLSSHRARTQS